MRARSAQGWSFLHPWGAWLRHISEVSAGVDTADPRKKFMVSGGLSLVAGLLTGDFSEDLMI